MVEAAPVEAEAEERDFGGIFFSHSDCAWTVKLSREPSLLFHSQIHFFPFSLSLFFSRSLKSLWTGGLELQTTFCLLNCCANLNIMNYCHTSTDFLLIFLMYHVPYILRL